MKRDWSKYNKELTKRGEILNYRNSVRYIRPTGLIALSSYSGVTYGNGLFVAVGSKTVGNSSEGFIFTSRDGIN